MCGGESSGAFIGVFALFNMTLNVEGGDMANGVVVPGEELLYSEREMKAALGLIDKLQRDNREVVRCVWALVKAAGGEIRVPHGVMAQYGRDRTLEAFEATDGGCKVFRAE